MNEKYTIAKFWKCALQVNPYSYIKYRGIQQSLTEDEYNNNLFIYFHLHYFEYPVKGIW